MRKKRKKRAAPAETTVEASTETAEESSQAQDEAGTSRKGKAKAKKGKAKAKSGKAKAKSGKAKAKSGKAKAKSGKAKAELVEAEDEQAPAEQQSTDEPTDEAKSADAKRGDDTETTEANLGDTETDATDGEPAEASASEDGTDATEAPVALEGERLARVLESLLFVADGPLTLNRMRHLTRVKSNLIVREAIESLTEEYAERGLVIYKVSGGYQFRSHSSSSPWVQKLVVGKPVRLTRAQLDTLAIIAYRQPITRPEIDDIRGVDSGGTLRLLLERDLIRVLGKKEEPGRPLLYGTTNEFLEFFNLNDLRDLPTLREYSELTDESMAVVTDKLGEDALAEAEFEVAGNDGQGDGNTNDTNDTNDGSGVPERQSQSAEAGDEETSSDSTNDGIADASEAVEDLEAAADGGLGADAELDGAIDASEQPPDVVAAEAAEAALAQADETTDEVTVA